MLLLTKSLEAAGGHLVDRASLSDPTQTTLRAHMNINTCIQCGKPNSISRMAQQGMNYPDPAYMATVPVDELQALNRAFKHVNQQNRERWERIKVSSDPRLARASKLARDQTRLRAKLESRRHAADKHSK